MAEIPIHNTFVVERHYTKPVARVFAAFADPALKRRWYADGRGHEVDIYNSDFRIGGSEKFVCRLGEATPMPGLVIENDGLYIAIVPDARIVMTSAMSFAGKLGSASLLTFEFIASGDGTDLICTHQGVFFEGSDGPQMREHGWRTLLERVETAL